MGPAHWPAKVPSGESGPLVRDAAAKASASRFRRRHGLRSDQRHCKLRFSLAMRSWIGAGLTVGGFVFEDTVSSAANRNRLLWSAVARHRFSLRRRCFLGRAVLAGSCCRTRVKRASWLRCEKRESGVEPPHSKGPPVERPFGAHTGSNDYREEVADQSPGSRSAPWVERSPPSKPQRGFTIRPSGHAPCVEPRWGTERLWPFVTQGGAPRLRRCADPGLWSATPLA